MDVLGEIVRGVTTATAIAVSTAAASLSDPKAILDGDLTHNPSQRQLTSEVDANLGIEDLRRPVMQGEKLYESVVSLNSAECTGTIVDIEGYEVIDSGTLVLTAAHCVEGYNPEDITINGQYVNDEGNVTKFQMQSAEVWEHPFYQEFNTSAAVSYDYSSADVAFIYTPEATPNGVLKAEFTPFDIDKRIAEITVNPELIEEGEDPKITAAGFSGDVVGLHTHENANIIGFDSQVIGSDIDDAQGASGGPNYLSVENGNPITLNERGQPEVIAVNSAGDTVTEENPYPENAYSTMLKPEFVETIPFLKKDGEGICPPPTAIVNTESGINIRYGGDTSFEELVKDQNGPSELPWGSQVNIYDLRNNHLGEEWALVTSENGRTGYVASQYLDVTPPTCLPEIKF